MEENTVEKVEVNAELMKTITSFVRHVRFACGYTWRACEEVSAELRAENQALPEYAELLLEDIGTRADALAEEAKHIDFLMA